MKKISLDKINEAEYCIGAKWLLYTQHKKHLGAESVSMKKESPRT